MNAPSKSRSSRKDGRSKAIAISVKTAPRSSGKRRKWAVSFPVRFTRRELETFVVTGRVPERLRRAMKREAGYSLAVINGEIPPLTFKRFG